MSFIGNPGGEKFGLEELDFTYSSLGLLVSMTSTEAIYVKDVAYKDGQSNGWFQGATVMQP